MKKRYIALIGFLSVFCHLQAMDKITSFLGIFSEKQPQEKKLPKELTDASFNFYLNQLETDVKNEDFQSIKQHFNALFKATNEFNAPHDQMQAILGQATDIIFPYANQIITSSLNRDQKLDILSSLAYIFVDTAYHSIISDEIKKLLAQPQTSPGVEPTKKLIPLGYLERKTKEAIAEENIDALKTVLQEAKIAQALTIQKEIEQAIKSLQAKLEEEQTEFYKEEPEKENGNGVQTFNYIQNTLRDAAWSGEEKLNELRDIFMTLERDHPYYEEVKKAITKIKAKRAK